MNWETKNEKKVEREVKGKCKLEYFQHPPHLRNDDGVAHIQLLEIQKVFQSSHANVQNFIFCSYKCPIVLRKGFFIQEKTYSNISCSLVAELG